MAAQDRIPLIITLDGSRPLKEVAGDLLQAGFNVEQELEAVNILTGSHGDPNDLAKLRAVSGVADVSPDEPIQLPPPGDPTTW